MGGSPVEPRGEGGTLSHPSPPPHILVLDGVLAYIPWSPVDPIAYHPQSIN